MTKISFSREAIADWATVLMAASAVTVAGVFLWERVKQPEDPSADRVVDEWEAYTDGGRRLGPENATVTIVEFGDYECPFCQRFDVAAREVLAAYPLDVAIIYRHYPLPYHAHAYASARLAECAAEQDRFQAAHTLLYDAEALSDIDAETFGQTIGVRDLPSFVSCAVKTAPVPAIEADIALAKELEISSTPTVVVNGLELGRTPDFARLVELVEEALGERKAES